MTKKERIKYQDWVTSYRKSLTAHFMSRCNHRLNWTPTHQDVKNIHSTLQYKVPDNCICEINEEEQKKLNVRSINGRRWYCIKYMNLLMESRINFWVCYDTKVKNVITALPFDELPNVAGCVEDEILVEFNKGFEEKQL